MTPRQQREWLSNNGFEEQFYQNSVDSFTKTLSHDRRLSFEYWYETMYCKSHWSITIFEPVDESALTTYEITLIDDIDPEEDFTKFQPLIDLIK